VVANRFDVAEDEFRFAAIQREAPEPLRGVRLDADDGDVLTVGRDRRRVLASAVSVTRVIDRVEKS
jgi:hypothetical protein